MDDMKDNKDNTIAIGHDGSERIDIGTDYGSGNVMMTEIMTTMFVMLDIAWK